MKVQLAAISTLCAFLSACGGGSDGVTAVTVDPGDDITQVANTGPAEVIYKAANQATRLEFQKSKNEVIVEAIPFDDDVFEGRYASTPGLDQGGYQAYTSVNGFDNYVAFRRKSSTGGVSAIVVNSGEYADHGYSGATFQRKDTVTLPRTTQRAFYNGKYIGERTSAETGGMDIITADAEIEADFSDDVVRGFIINRSMTQSQLGVGVGGPITYKNTGINRLNGTFVGETTQDAGALTGEYVGTFGGNSATETAGYSIVEGSGLREIGVFVAEQ
jgi:hypothetical protein